MPPEHRGFARQPPVKNFRRCLVVEADHGHDHGHQHKHHDPRAVGSLVLLEQGGANAQFNLGSMYDFGEGVPSARESNRDTGRALLTQDLTQVLKAPDNLRNNLDRPGHFGHRVYRCRYLHAGRKQCKSDEVRPTLQRRARLWGDDD